MSHERDVLLIAMALTLTAGAPAFCEDAGLAWIRPDADGTHFIEIDSGRRFTLWGVNYDHDATGRLLEDYWEDEWPTVVADFQEIKALGANVVRIHLQTGRFMVTAHDPNEQALARLACLITLAEQTGLYLDITGLACYRKPDVPAWYDALNTSQRWDVQARFWEAVARTCASSPAVFCYDLMNEPILPGPGQVETEWVVGRLDDKYFVQRITLDLAGRTRREVAQAWVDKLVTAIHKYDERHMITVGVIPWVYVFPQAKPLFYAPQVGIRLDFVSVHFYPKRGEVDKALMALAAYDVGKPLVIEEMFPLNCSQEEMDTFIDRSRPIADGYLSFYWGKTAEQCAQDDNLPSAVIAAWLRYFRAKARDILP